MIIHIIKSVKSCLIIFLLKIFLLKSVFNRSVFFKSVFKKLTYQGVYLENTIILQVIFQILT